MADLPSARGRVAAALALAGSLGLLAACNTVGGTMRGMGQDISNTGQALTGNQPTAKTPPPAGTPAPAGQPTTGATPGSY